MRQHPRTCSKSSKVLMCETEQKLIPDCRKELIAKYEKERFAK